jgi:hypothetical protein
MQDQGEGPASLGYEKVLAGLQLVSTLAAAQLFDVLLAWRKASLKLTSTQQSDQITILRKRVQFCQGYSRVSTVWECKALQDCIAAYQLASWTQCNSCQDNAGVTNRNHLPTINSCKVVIAKRSLFKLMSSPC